MDANLKQKWIDALRSGEFEQAHGTLCDDGGAYCCLGVLAKVAGLKIVEDADVHGNDEGAIEIDGTKHGYKPLEEMIGKPTMLLSQKNDGLEAGWRQWTFPELAEWIEANIPAT